MFISVLGDEDEVEGEEDDDDELGEDDELDEEDEDEDEEDEEEDDDEVGLHTLQKDNLEEVSNVLRRLLMIREGEGGGG